MWIGSLGPRMFWGTRATNSSIYTTKMEGAGLKILGTGAKFKQVPCQKNCRVNRAVDWQGKNDIIMNFTLRSLDGIHQITKRNGYAAEVLIGTFLTLLTLSRPRGSPLTSKIVWR